ncbi:MAG: class I SAM-dependent methyltransferase [Humidesulfovibrio sp.]|nr:class I SAM-dependent methyltransferase [Humidesulfovibrio sp.]
MTDAFAERAAGWDANPVRAAVGYAFYEEVLRAHPDFAGRMALEFGCGTGTLGLRLGLAHQARVIFVDTSPAMLDVLRGKIAAQGPADAQVLLGELADLPLPETSVDAILSGMALHHVVDVPGALRQFRRLLKPGGLALVGDLMPEDGSFHGPEPAPHNGFDPLELAGAFTASGFAPRTHHVFHILKKPDAAGTLREYRLFFLAAQAV